MKGVNIKLIYICINKDKKKEKCYGHQKIMIMNFI